ncbi:MAG TPA: hypothetical protein VK447_13870 [Myxococcaceae bacterium]|nr:hypothetical protein [Myxococcaceae bacterium]
MRRRVLIVVLALGTVFGFASGFRSLAYYRNGGHGCGGRWNDRQMSYRSNAEADRLAAEDRLADKVTQRVLAALAKATPAQAPQPQQQPVQMAPVVVVPPIQMVAPMAYPMYPPQPAAYPAQPAAYPAQPPVAPAATAPQTAQALPPPGR